MASKSAIFCIFALGLAVANGAVTVVDPSTPTNNYVTTVTGGTWPVTGETPVAIPDDTVILKLINVNFNNVDTILPVKETVSPGAIALPSLKTISIENSVSTGADGTTKVQFPLVRFASMLDKSKIERLEFKAMQLGAINETYFAGFNKLIELFLINSGVSDIGVKTFDAQAAATPVLHTLQIKDDTVLKQFAWELLAPVAASIKDITFSQVSELESLTYTAPTTPLSLSNLLSLTISKTKLKSVPENILNTLSGGNGPAFVALKFQSNQNDCDTCEHLKPLVSWVRAKEHRNLDVTCIKPNNGGEDPASGNSTVWKTRNDCGFDPTPSGAGPSFSLSHAIVLIFGASLVLRWLH